MATRLANAADICGSILALWLDANDSATITQSAGTVSQWLDKSVSSGARTGNAATATQTTASKQPAYNASAINGMPALVPAGAQFLTIAAANQPAKYASASGISAMCVVVRPSATGAIFSGGNNNNDTGGPELRFDQNAVNVVNSYTTDVVRTAAAAAGPHLAGMDASSSGTTAWLDGTGTTTATDAAFKAPLSQIFCNVYGTDYYNGAVGEIVYTSLRLTTAQRQQLEGYLAWKWGLQSLLPSSHPYKSAAPTVDTGSGATYSGAISLGANPAQITASLLSGVSAAALAAAASCGATGRAVYPSAVALGAIAGIAGTLGATLSASIAVNGIGGTNASATAALSAALAVAASMAQDGATSLSATAALSLAQAAGLTDAGTITAAQTAALAAALAQSASSGGAAYASAMQIAAAAAVAMIGANGQAASIALPVTAAAASAGTAAYVGSATLAGVARQGASVQAITVAAAALAEAFGVNTGTGGAQSYAGAVALAVAALNAANAASVVAARATLATAPNVQASGAAASVAAASLAAVADEAARSALTIMAGASFRASTQAFAAGSVVVTGTLSLPAAAGLAPQVGTSVAASVAFTAHFDAAAVASITAAEVAPFAAQAALQAVLQVGDLYAGAPKLRGVRTLTLTLEGRRMGTRTLAGTVRLTFGPSSTTRH